MFKKSTWNSPPNSILNWNAYVKATIAFLNKDVDALQRYRDEIAQDKGTFNGNNLRVVNNMLMNHNKSYYYVYNLPKSSQGNP
jgi:hypothetical protein